MKVNDIREAGVGKITKQNTTVDVKPGETERQAKKFFGGSGKPKPLGVPGATPNQAFNLGLVESDKEKDTLKGMDPKTVRAVQNLLIKFPHAKDPMTAIIADIEDSQAISIRNDKNNELRDKTLKHRIDKLEMRLSDLENKPSTNVAEDETEDELSVIQRAEMFAQQAHKDHKRKYTGEPYYVHLDEVRRIVKSAGGSEDMQAAALLHDTVEDTATTSQDILKEFGPQIAKLVVELTDVSKPEDGNRKARKGIDRDKLSMVSADAQTVKYADLISNGRDIGQNDPKFAKVYHAEKADLLRVMKKGNSNLRNAAIDMLPDELRSIAMENMSVTGTERRRLEKKKGIEVGTPEWFKHWFDLPYLREDAGIQKVDIDQLERFADKLFGKVGIDVEFTRHFMDRVNDVRNQKPITMSELTRLFKQEYKRWGRPIAQMGPNSQAVMKDLQTDINLPFVLQWDDKNDELDLIAKTVMRKADFKTSNKEFPVENVPATNQAGTIGQHINWGGKNKPTQNKKVVTRGTQNPQNWWQSMLQKGKNLFDDEQLDLKKKFEVTDELNKLANIFNRGGHEIRIVGGAVRDLALNKTPKDIDLASDATPDEMQKMFDSAGVRHIPTGIEHGTITAVINGEEFEITTLRADVETDGRRAEVEFVRSWEEDAKRRDLTYNAMSMDFEGNLYDYHGGMDDLQDKVTRFVGDPEERIKEDYLRTLRYFRFQGRLDTPTFDRDTMQAIANNTAGLKQLSVERVWMEMGKILSGDNIQQILSAMQKTGVLGAVGLNVKSSQDVMNGGDPIINLARITNDESIGVRWKMSNEEKSKLGFLISQKGQTHDKKWYTDQMADGFDRTQLDALARYNNQDDMIAYIKSFKAPEFPVDGNDLMQLGHARGPNIGKTLQALRTQWKAGNFNANKDELLKSLSEDIMAVNDTDHAIERLKVAAELCNKMGNQPILYRAMKTGTYHGGAKQNLIQKVGNPARKGVMGNHNPIQVAVLDGLNIVSPAQTTTVAPSSTSSYFGTNHIIIPGGDFTAYYNPDIDDLGGFKGYDPKYQKGANDDKGGTLTRGKEDLPDEEMQKILSGYQKGIPSYSQHKGEVILDTPFYYILNLQSFLSTFGGKKVKELITVQNRSTFSPISAELLASKFKTYSDIGWYLANPATNMMKWIASKEKTRSQESVKVDEAMDNPYPYKLEGPNKTGTWVGKADTSNGPLVMDFDGNESQDDFSIDFAVNNRMGNEGTGDAFRIFATVMAIMNEWISKVGIERVQQFDFNADKDEHDSDGRSKLYDRFAKKLASQLGWSVRKSEVGNGSADFFSLQNPNPQKNENFADGKKPGRKGLSKRVGIPKGATLAQLEKIAKSSSGERRRMAQWQLNMRRGKNKSK